MITKKIRIQFVDTDASGRIHYSAISVILKLWTMTFLGV